MNWLKTCLGCNLYYSSAANILFVVIIILHSCCLVASSEHHKSNSNNNKEEETSNGAKIHSSKGSQQPKNPIVFGEGRPSIHVPVVESVGSSISPKEFFTNYVKKQEVVLFKGAIQKSKAYKLWSDEYFRQLTDIPKGHDVLVESRKKENRTMPPTRMPFKEFVEIYNLTDQYMVEPVPDFLRYSWFISL